MTTTPRLLPLLALTLALAACGQTNPAPADAAQATPTLQVQRLLCPVDTAAVDQFADPSADPATCENTMPEDPGAPADPTQPVDPALESPESSAAVIDPAIDAAVADAISNAAYDPRLAYIKAVAWGSVANYDGQYARYAGTSQPYSQLNWGRDGCTTQGFGLGYTEDFRAACNVHDFGYRNLSRWERTAANRMTTDQNFLRNMRNVCAAKSWFKRPACNAAALAYYNAVRLAGNGYFTP